MPAFEKEIFVNLVGENEQVMLLCKCGNQFQFLPGEYLARGIGRSVDQNSTGARGNDALQRFRGKFPVGGLQSHKERHCIYSDERVKVIAVVRLKQDDLVTRIEDRKSTRLNSS